MIQERTINVVRPTIHRMPRKWVSQEVLDMITRLSTNIPAADRWSYRNGENTSLLPGVCLKFM